MEYMESRMQDRYEAMYEETAPPSNLVRAYKYGRPDDMDKARGYELAAQWHDKQEKACREIAGDIRVGAHVNLKAAVAATHHGASAAGLRNAASRLMRPTTTE